MPLFSDATDDTAMMRRTTLRGHQALVKGPQIPGPTLHG